MATETTRRALFGGAGLVALAAAVPAVASTMSTSSGVSPALAKLIAAADEAKRQCDDFDTATYDPLKARTDALIDAVPHVTVDIQNSPFWTTAESAAVSLARDIVRGDPGRLHPSSAQLRRLVAADLHRTRQAQRMKRQTGLQAAYDRSNALADTMATTEWDVALFPCETAADLHAKLAFMMTRQMDDGVAVLDVLLPDAARIANKEG
ncbi:hypothetical protein ACQR50_14200 [Sphingomonas sp. Xoc002]|uniref:hypothetical protein n=1 Tax=Sphingomonas sp. Xoc002 TaxID=2837624 RepID=UPI003D18443C